MCTSQSYALKNGPISTISARARVPMLKPPMWLTMLLFRQGKCGPKRKEVGKAHRGQHTEMSLPETEDRGRNLNSLISLSGGTMG